MVGPPTLADLADTVLVGTRASVPLGAVLVKLGGRAGAQDKTTGDFVPAWEVNAIHPTKDVVASSDAIGAAMLTQIRHGLDTGALFLVPVHTPWLRLNYGFIRRRDSATSAGALEFMAALRSGGPCAAERLALRRTHAGRAVASSLSTPRGGWI